jgi:hypothetical protein
MRVVVRNVATCRRETYDIMLPESTQYRINTIAAISANVALFSVPFIIIAKSVITSRKNR